MKPKQPKLPGSTGSRGSRELDLCQGKPSTSSVCCPQDQVGQVGTRWRGFWCIWHRCRSENMWKLSCFKHFVTVLWFLWSVLEPAVSPEVSLILVHVHSTMHGGFRKWGICRIPKTRFQQHENGHPWLGWCDSCDSLRWPVDTSMRSSWASWSSLRGSQDHWPNHDIPWPLGQCGFPDDSDLWHHQKRIYTRRFGHFERENDGKTYCFGGVPPIFRTSFGRIGCMLGYTVTGAICHTHPLRVRQSDFDNRVLTWHWWNLGLLRRNPEIKEKKQLKNLKGPWEKSLSFGPFSNHVWIMVDPCGSCLASIMMWHPLSPIESLGQEQHPEPAALLVHWQLPVAQVQGCHWVCLRVSPKFLYLGISDCQTRPFFVESEETWCETCLKQFDRRFLERYSPKNFALAKFPKLSG